MTKKGHILIKLRQFEDNVPLISMWIYSFWSKKKFKRIPEEWQKKFKGHRMWVLHAISV